MHTVFLVDSSSLLIDTVLAVCVHYYPNNSVTQLIAPSLYLARTSTFLFRCLVTSPTRVQSTGAISSASSHRASAPSTLKAPSSCYPCWRAFPRRVGTRRMTAFLTVTNGWVFSNIIVVLFSCEQSLLEPVVVLSAGNDECIWPAALFREQLACVRLMDLTACQY